jgi:hypothetical protein
VQRGALLDSIAMEIPMLLASFYVEKFSWLTLNEKIKKINGEISALFLNLFKDTILVCACFF